MERVKTLQAMVEDQNDELSKKPVSNVRISTPNLRNLI